jgi:hypothetical protein
MKRLWVVLLVAGACALGIKTQAHHSFAATYLEGKTVTIEGQMVQFLFRNPHSFVHVMVKEDGQMVRYAVEWGGTGQLGEQGVSGETLKPGDVIVVTGAPGRNPKDHRIRMVTLLRPRDGFGWGTKENEVVN